MALSDFGSDTFPAEAEDVLQEFFSSSYVAGEAVDTTETHSHPYALRDLDDTFIHQNVTSDLNSSGSKDFGEEITKTTKEFFLNVCCQKACNRHFDEKLVIQVRLEVMENEVTCADHINHNHLFILGQLSALTGDGDTITRDRRHSSEGDSRARVQNRTDFKFRGQEVCRRFFMHVNNWAKKRLANLQASLKENGVQLGPHGNTGKVPKHTTKLEKIQEMCQFLKNFSNVHGLVLPGRVAHIRDDCQDPDSGLQNFTEFVYKNLRLQSV